MVLRPAVTALMFCIASAASLHAQQSGAAQTRTVRGMVVDARTHVPVATVVVQIVDSAGRPLATTVSNNDGIFRLTAPVITAYWIRAERIGYYPQEMNLSRTTALDVSVELLIRPSPILLDSLLVAGTAAVRTLRRTEQLLHGRLLDDRARTPIAGGTIELFAENGRKIVTTVTDRNGLFRLITPIPGGYTVRASAMGYRTADSPVLKTILGDTIRFDFHLDVDAVLLAPITVEASPREWVERTDQSMLRDLHQRMARYGNFGAYMTRDSIAYYEKQYYTTSELLYWKLNAGFGYTGGCRGRAYFLNGGPYEPMGMPVGEIFTPHMLEAIEVYKAPRIPGELTTFTPGFSGPPCEVVVLWTRR